MAATYLSHYVAAKLMRAAVALVCRVFSLLPRVVPATCMLWRGMGGLIYGQHADTKAEQHFQYACASEGKMRAWTLGVSQCDESVASEGCVQVGQ